MPWVIGGAMIGSALIGGVGAYESGQSSAKAAKKLYKNRYQWQVNDLKKAGLNPMLATQLGAPVPSQPQFPDVGSAAVDAGAKGASAASAVKLAQDQRENIQAATNLTMAQGQKQQMENVLLEASPLYQSAKAQIGPMGEIRGTSAEASRQWNLQLSEVENRAGNIAADTALKGIQYALAQGDLSLKEIQVKYAPEMAKIAKSYQDAMAQAAQAGVPEAVADAKFWENAGPFAKLAVFIKSMIK